MSKYINRDSLTERLRNLIAASSSGIDYDYGYSDCLYDVIEIIGEMPTSDLTAKLAALESEIKRLKLELQYTKADVGDKVEPVKLSDEWQQAIGLE